MELLLLVFGEYLISLTQLSLYDFCIKMKRPLEFLLLSDWSLFLRVKMVYMPVDIQLASIQMNPSKVSARGALSRLKEMPKI